METFIRDVRQNPYGTHAHTLNMMLCKTLWACIQQNTRNKNLTRSSTQELKTVQLLSEFPSSRTTVTSIAVASLVSYQEFKVVMKISYQWRAAVMLFSVNATLQIEDVQAKKHSVRRHVNKQTNQATVPTPMENTPPSYGVDVSFPMHHEHFSMVDNPLGDSQKTVYADFMDGCRTAYPQLADRCEMYEKDRIEVNMKQPATLQVR